MRSQVVVAGYTDNLVVLDVDTDAPKLSVAALSLAGQNLSWATPHPTDPSIVFATNEVSDGVVTAVQFDQDGRGTVVARVDSGGGSPAHAKAISDTELLVANYMGGSIRSISISSSPLVLQPNAPAIVFDYPGLTDGAVPSRQECAHPHEVVLHPAREELLVPDLGCDKLFRLLRSGENGGWKLEGELVYPRGSGPRHVVIYENRILFSVLELSNRLSAHLLPPLPAQPTHLATVPSGTGLPILTAKPAMLAAEIFIPPTSESFPTPYIYLSNRNHPSGNDSISIFSFTAPSDLTPDTFSLDLVAEVRTGLAHVRGMMFDKSWRFLVAAGQHNNCVKLFERIDGGRDLKELASVESKQPTGVLWL